MTAGDMTDAYGAAGVLLSGLLTYNSKQWLPALRKRLSKEKAA